MQKLSKDATRIFLGILNRIPEGETHTKIQIHQGEDPIFMPLSVEYLYDVEISGAKAKVYSLMHYFMQEGDLMRDPDVEFAVLDLRSEQYPVIEQIAIYPIMMQQHTPPAFCHEVATIASGKIVSYKHKAQRDIALFCNKWMNNIKHQQNIEPVKVPDVLQWMMLQKQTEKSKA
jgi:hypothetical protein